MRDAREQAEAAAGERDAALGALSALTEQEGADRARVHVASGQAEDLRRQLVEAQLRAEHLQGDCALRLEQVARLQASLTVGLLALINGWRFWPSSLAGVCWSLLWPRSLVLVFGSLICVCWSAAGEAPAQGDDAPKVTQRQCSLVVLCKENAWCILPHGTTHSTSAPMYVCRTCWICSGGCTVPLSAPGSSLLSGIQAWPNALKEAESDAAASQVQVATMQRQLTAVRCTSLLELRQQVLGAAGADTSAPRTSSGEFSFRPSGAANEVWWLKAKTKLCTTLQGRGSGCTFLPRLPCYDVTLDASPTFLCSADLLRQTLGAERCTAFCYMHIATCH